MERGPGVPQRRHFNAQKGSEEYKVLLCFISESINNIVLYEKDNCLR
jgi:hypothetical protein